MKTNKNTMSKIAQIHKEELSAEKVELNMQQDIDKVLDRLISEFQSLRSIEGDIDVQFEKVKRAKADLDDFIRDAKQAQKETQKRVQEANQVKAKAEKAAKDLGVDAKAIKGYNEIDDIISEAEEEIRNITSFIKQVS
jgi:hypothetical protein